MLEKQIKQVKYLLPTEEIDMGGFAVKQAFPTKKIQQIDPFLLLHHGHTQFYNDRLAKHQGIGPHPHRGFSPVTFVIEGEVHHRDSWENNQIAKKGEVQWLNAGAGIIHSERPSQKMIENNNFQEIIQLWINTPASKKMQPPEYYYLSEDNIPVFNSKDKKIKNKLITGTYNELEGRINSKSELLIIWSTGKVGGRETFEIPKGYNCMLYVIKGSLRIKEYGLVESEHLVVFEEKGSIMEVILKEETQFLLLCGKAIGEEVTKHGPYIMNTQTEILEAMRDYQMGKMGILIEEE